MHVFLQAKEGEGKEMDKAPEDAAATAPKEGGPKPKTWALRIKSADQVRICFRMSQVLIKYACRCTRRSTRGSTALTTLSLCWQALLEIKLASMLSCTSCGY